MKMRKAFDVFGLATLLTVAWAANLAVAQTSDIIIGAGEQAGVHYNVGRAICRQVAKSGQGLTCEALRIERGHAAEPLAVLANVRNGTIEAGIVASDWHYFAVKGTGPAKFLDEKFDTLRSLFSLYGEPFTVIARRDAGIDGLDDLAGKRVNIGNPGSNARTVMEMVMKAKGWTQDSFQLADGLTEAEQYLALCHNRVQATVMTGAHPNARIAQALKLCDAKIVDVTGPAIDKLIGENPYFARISIPGGVYGKSAKAVKSFGVTVTVVSSTDVSDDVAYALTNSVFNNLDALKRVHPALMAINQSQMRTDGLTAPLHPGALRYFREKGMM